MIHALQPFNPETTPKSPTGQLTAAQKNPAVAQCREAWLRAYDAVRKSRKSNDLARAKANMAYREAMPSLVGYNDICYFIACVGYGMLTGIFGNSEGPKLLYGAQVALSTIAPEAKSQRRTPPKPAYPLPSSANFADIK